MLTYTTLPLLPVKVMGSHGTPGWMWAFRDAVADATAGPADLKEAMTDAAKLAIMDMTEAGADIISDGEMFRADFTWNFHEYVTGLESIAFDRKLGYPGPDQLNAFRCVAPVDVPNGYGLKREVDFLKKRTNIPFVIGLQSPATQVFRIDPGTIYKNKGELAWAMVPHFNRELKEAVAAGARHVQFDEPAFWTMPGGYEEWVELFNACVEGLDQATVEAHLCFGNYKGRAVGPRQYAPMFPAFLDFHVDELHLEMASREFSELHLLKEISTGMDVAVGVVDVKSYYIETPEDIARRVEMCLDHAAPEKLSFAPDCGLSQTARWAARQKLANLVAGVNLAREKLGLG